jgi:alcohol dehydrogenase/propanol-preferring alcohol dehydrogenase
MLRAYQLAAFGQPFVPVEKELPVPQGSQVLVKVHVCGVCHSDLHLWDGYWDLGNDKKLSFGGGGKLLPLTLGHEIVGTVVAVGTEAREAKVGDRRVVFPWIGCGECATCKTGQEHICQGAAKAIGIFVDGGYASHVMVPHPRYLVDFDGIPEELACTYACSGLTAYSALKKIGPLKAGESLLIVGAGGVGLNAIRLARAVTGAAPIVADIDPAKREAAKASGAADAIDPAADGALKSLLKATGGVSGAIDFAGAPASFNFAQGALRKGGRMVLVGLLGGAVSLSLPLLAMRAISIAGSYVGSLEELRELVALARRAGVQPIPIATRPLAQVTEALGDLKAGKVVGRVVLRP